MKIAISADSAIDTQKELLDEYDIHVIPYGVILGEEEVMDEGLNADDLYKFVKETGKLPKTTAINPARFYYYFKDLLKDHDYVIHFSLTDTMSSTYNNAVQAAQSFDGKVFVINSKSFSVGILLECLYCKRLIKCGKYSVEEIVDKVNKRKKHVIATVLMETTEYLYKGGRCNAVAHLSAKLLGLRPMIIYDQKDLKVHKIFRGKYHVICKKYVKEAINMYPNPDKDLVVVSGTIVDPGIMDIITGSINEEVGFKKTILTRTNATISTYGGKNALGFGYFNDGGIKDEDL